LGDPLEGNLLLFYKPLHLEAQQVSTRIEVRRHQAAHARIVSLEAELEASRIAFDAATAAKVNAKKSSKSALAKAKKAEKDLGIAKKEHLQREQAVAERLNQMSAAAGGTYYTLFYVDGFLALLRLLMYSFSAVLLFL
jgi:hypothetical protein